MWVPLLLLIIGFIALVWSADRFLSGAAACARNMGVSKMLIGLTVVSLGTSAPEVLAMTLLFDRELSFWDGAILLTGLGAILWSLVKAQSKPNQELSAALQDELEELPDMTNLQAIAWLVLGLLVLLISAQVLVHSASSIAKILGVSDMIIGLTIVAIGTSLPELAATIGSAIKGHPDIAIGNVVGSNILNILAVLAVPALISGTGVPPAAFWRDGGMMLALTLMLALFAYGINSRPVITRFEGLVMLAAWIGYNLLLVQHA
jgi:cation:H+ antiporter